MTETSHALELRQIRKSFGAVHVIHGIDLEIEEGEFVVFVGPSGCGKSTLLRLIAGLDDPTSGDIFLKGRRVNAVPASERGLSMLDAPVSGGVGGAEAGTLTFMVGGSDEAFARARDILDVMGKAVIHAGAEGNGQAAKICNNMILGISMIAVSEAFVLAENLGLSADKLFEISSQSSGQCWSMTAYCPVPGQ